MNLKRVPHSERVSLDGYSLGSFVEEIEKKILASIGEAIEETWANDEFAPCASLPYRWGEGDGLRGPPVSDPLTIDFELPLFSADIGCGPVWRTSLREIVLDEIEDGDVGLARSIRDALRKFADEIDPDTQTNSI